MKISLSWLQDYVVGDIQKLDKKFTLAQIAGEVAQKLTSLGIEVEAIEEIGLDFSGVVSAKIISARPHPNADKLNLCTVHDGKETLEIVCGAKNWKVGDIIPFAKVGAVLPGGLTIAPKALKGIESHGMLCSEKELGLAEDASGLWILPPDTELGLDLAKAVRDTVLVLGVTPNRPDCLSHIGVAREVALAFGLTLKLPASEVSTIKEETKDACKVFIEDSEGCPRYAARVLRGVSLKPSPLWLQRRLQAVGVRAISNIVDVTNYVMMEMGQPLHAFDLSHLADSTIKVRRATAGEKMKTLDGQEHTFAEDGALDLMIADAEKSVAIAGVMGGLTSEVTDATKDILLESAYFHPSWVRRTSKRQKLHTESSHRFERGCDPDGVLFAQDRALSLMQQLAGGDVLSGRVDVYPKVIERRKISLRPSRIRQVLGVDAPMNGLEGLGLKKLSEDASATLWEIPNARPDLEREIDLVEEVARLYGIDNIEPKIPKMSVNAEPVAELRAPVESIERLRSAVRLAGVSEAVCYAFCGEKNVADLGLPKEDARARPVKLANPIADDLNVLRTSLLPGLLLSVGRNQKRQRGDVRLFEIGRVFLENGREAPKESVMMGVILSGETQHWWGKASLDFFDAKGLCEALVSSLSLPLPRMSAATSSFAVDGASANILVQNTQVGSLCELHPEVLGRFDVVGRVFYLELSLAALEGLVRPVARYQEFSRFPAVTRDIAFIAAKSLSWGEIEGCINSVRSEIVQRVSLFDLYQGQNVPEGSRSLAISLTYQSSAKTLTDEEVSASHDRILKTLRDQLQVTIR